MRKTLIAQPKSKFLKIKCVSCGNEQIMFDHAKIKIECHVCGELLAYPAGGKAKLTDKVEVLGVLDDLNPKTEHQESPSGGEATNDGAAS